MQLSKIKRVTLLLDKSITLSTKVRPTITQLNALYKHFVMLVSIISGNNIKYISYIKGFISLHKF